MASVPVGDAADPAAFANDGVLPTDVLSDVLLRVPAKALCRLRLVCRAWRSLTSGPRFAREHARRHPQFAGLRYGVAVRGTHRRRALRQHREADRRPRRSPSLLLLKSQPGHRRNRHLSRRRHGRRHRINVRPRARPVHGGVQGAPRRRPRHRHARAAVQRRDTRRRRPKMEGDAMSSYPPCTAFPAPGDHRRRRLLLVVRPWPFSMEEEILEFIASFDMAIEEWGPVLRVPQDDEKTHLQIAGLNGCLVTIFQHADRRTMDLWFMVDMGLWIKRYSIHCAPHDEKVFISSCG
ncbi:hypothetical protein ACP4OV_019011 [Aristida adscensionis]